jgi:hypothetical protein
MAFWRARARAAGFFEIEEWQLLKIPRTLGPLETVIFKKL